MLDYKKLKVNKDDIITVTAYELITAQECQVIINKLKEVFPDNKIILMPKHIDIEACSYSELDDIINSLIEIKNSRV